jgi:hypothetical protein
MIASLERMLEPDPDRRPTSLDAALAMAPPPAPLAPARGASPFDHAKEDAAVKSLRSLLWVLWGLGWVLVPVVINSLGYNPRLIPIAMFGSMAGIFILTWHKGALLRMVMRVLLDQEPTRAAAPPVASVPPRARIDVGAPPQVQVRVHGPAEAGTTEVVGDTEIAPRTRASRQR